MSAAQWLLAVTAVLVAAGLRTAWLYIRPYKACRTCAGRGHCIRCQYTGKVLRLGAVLIHPELKKK